MVTRENVCMRRLGGGKRSREVQFGRFLRNSKVTIDHLIEGWSERTTPAVVGRHVLAIQDTSEINFRTTPERRRGLGEIGKGVGRGVLLRQDFEQLAIARHRHSSKQISRINRITKQMAAQPPNG